MISNIPHLNTFDFNTLKKLHGKGTNRQTDRRSSRLLDWIGPVGRFGENIGRGDIFCVLNKCEVSNPTFNSLKVKIVSTFKAYSLKILFLCLTSLSFISFDTGMNAYIKEVILDKRWKLARLLGQTFKYP